MKNIYETIEGSIFNLYPDTISFVDGINTYFVLRSIDGDEVVIKLTHSYVDQFLDDYIDFLDSYSTFDNGVVFAKAVMNGYTDVVLRLYPDKGLFDICGEDGTIEFSHLTTEKPNGPDLSLEVALSIFLKQFFAQFGHG